MGSNPIDRGKPGVKRYPTVDRHGVPLAADLVGAERYDATVFASVIVAIPPVRRPRSRPNQRPKTVHVDKGDDARHCRRQRYQCGIKVRIACRYGEDTTRLGRQRCVVKRTLAWLNYYRRLAIRYERRAALHQAFLNLVCSPICLKMLRHHTQALCNELPAGP